MFKSIKKAEFNITVNLEESITGQACSQIIMEIVKYIMYQKQQIPISYDSITKLHANSKPTDRNFSSMRKLMNSLYNVSNHLTSQIALNGCDVKEIAVIIGATIVSPKLCIRFELPKNVLDINTHLDCEHSFRKPLLTVMRSILECSEFQEEMTISLGPTNTFMLIKKKDTHQISEFFIPKPQFVLPSNSISFHIRLNYDENNQLNCNCENLIKIHQDISKCGEENYTIEETINSEYEVCYQWYQSKEVFKGFKFLR